MDDLIICIFKDMHWKRFRPWLIPLIIAISRQNIFIFSRCGRKILFNRHLSAYVAFSSIYYLAGFPLALVISYMLHVLYI